MIRYYYGMSIENHPPFRKTIKGLFRADFENVIYERWDRVKGWVDCPSLVCVHGFGGDDMGMDDITETEAYNYIKANLG